MSSPQHADPISLDERIRRAEREVMLRDRRLLQRIDDVTRDTRSAARSGGRIALIGVGALATVWITWKVVKAVRRDPREAERERARERQAAYRYGHGLRDEPLPPEAKPGVFGSIARLGLILAPFVLPARSPAAAAASAFTPGGWWPMRAYRLARTAMDWRASHQAKQAAREARRAEHTHNVRTARAEAATGVPTPPAGTTANGTGAPRAY